MSQPSTAARGWGRGRRLSSLLCCLSSRPQQTSEAGAAFQVSQLQAGSPHPPLGVGDQEGLLSLECVKQWLAGFPGRKPGSRPHRCTGGLSYGRQVWGPPQGPPLPLASCPPRLYPLPPRQSATDEGPKGWGLRLPQQHSALPLPGPGQSHFPFLPSSELLL